MRWRYPTRPGSVLMTPCTSIPCRIIRYVWPGTTVLPVHWKRSWRTIITRGAPDDEPERSGIQPGCQRSQPYTSAATGLWPNPAFRFCLHRRIASADPYWSKPAMTSLYQKWLSLPKTLRWPLIILFYLVLIGGYLLWQSQRPGGA